MSLINKLLHLVMGKPHIVEVAEIAPVTLKRLDMGVTSHGLESRLDLINDRRTFTVASDDGKYVHWFRAENKLVATADPEEVGYGHPSYSNVTYHQHNYVGSYELPPGWIHEKVNHCLRAPDGNGYYFGYLFPEYGSQ